MFAARTPPLVHWLAGLRRPSAWRRPRRSESGVSATPSPAGAPPAAPMADADAALEAIPLLKVWLFGGLASLAKCRSFTIPLDAPTTVRAVLNDMAERFGPDFRDRIMQDNGELYGYCRLFLDGFPLTGLDKSILVKPGITSLELIVLTSSEGG